MPYRQLPATDASRSQALAAALKKSSAVAPTDRLISAETAAALATFVPDWEREIAERADAFGRQIASTGALVTAGETLRMTASHFLQVFQFGVARGVFPAAARASYELAGNEATVPDMTAEPDLLLWADRIVAGDPRRVAAFGGPAMAMPSAADVAAALTAYQSRQTLQTAAKDALEGEQSDVDDLRAAADALVKDVWDEVEFALRRLEAPTLRRRAREWGVFYALRPGETEDTPAPAPPQP